MPKITWLKPKKVEVNELAAVFRAYRKASGMSSAEIGRALGVTFDPPLVEQALTQTDKTSGKLTTSLQRDVMSGHQSEFESQVVEPVRIGTKYGLEMPAYRKAAETIIKEYGLDVSI